MFESIRGKVVLVTGGSRGIGREIVREFHKYGAKVAINYNSHEGKARELREELGERAEIFRADVSKRDEVRRMVYEIEKMLGKVDILVNNAGIVERMNFEEYDEERFDRLINVNVKGIIYTSLEVLPHMKEKRSGCIINIASIAGIGTAMLGSTYYAVSKGAVIILTKRMALDLGKYGIRVNAIAPGWIETDMTLSGRPEEEVNRIREYVRTRTILGRTGLPNDIAKVALFLAVADYMTGQVIIVDGGRIDFLTHGI
ncbi:MAG: glucose 1-dehydrogenase [Sulfolobaceae archaeon]